MFILHDSDIFIIYLTLEIFNSLCRKTDFFFFFMYYNNVNRKTAFEYDINL